METKIEILNRLEEITVPTITLTKSFSGKTGTATFLFLNPSCLKYILDYSFPISNIKLIKNTKTIQTSDIQIFFHKGKPYLLKAIFLFKTGEDWFNFFCFMSSYSKERGLVFQET